MSVIVAVKHGGIVYMGADTQTTYYNDIKKNSLIESERKIAKLESGLLLGGVGNGDVITRIVYSKGVFNVPPEGLSKKYIVTKIVPALFKFLDERKLLADPEEDEDETSCSMRCSLMLVHKDKMFYINRNLGVWGNDKFSVAGSGCSYAFPYLNSFDFKGDVNEQLLSAMRGCAKHDSSISAPFILIDSKNLEFKVAEA